MISATASSIPPITSIPGLLVILIVFSSIVVGICHIQSPKRLGRIGFRTVMFYFITTIIAICIGLALTYIIKPGQGLEKIRVGLKPNHALTLKDLLL